MQSLTPLCVTNSSVPSSLSSSNDIHNGNQKQVIESQAQLSNLHPRTIPRHSFLIRTIIFVVLEFGFIALASAALWKPIILHLSVTITEVKGAVTVISIFWHALAIYSVNDILLNIFSAEWTKLDDGSHNLSLQELDSVSRLTTGLVDQVKHFVSKRATHSFRLGFLSLLLLILLNGLGPGAIGVNPVPYLYPSSIPVANLTIGVPGFAPSLAFVATSRASSITQLEIVENFTTSGYHATQPNILIPWPLSESLSENPTVTYQSDVIGYNFNCSWKKPSKSNFTTNAWVVEGQGWTPYPLAESGIGLFTDPIIFPLMRVNATSAITVDFKTVGSNSLSSFIFIQGENSSTTYLSLEGIPSIVRPCNPTQNLTHPRDTIPEYDCQPLLISFLVCNPHLEIFPAIINATASSVDATILSGAPTVKNIPREAANTIFSSSLLDATSEMSHLALFNAISSRLFFDEVPSYQGTDPAKPLSLPEINQKMNKVLASSAKAYLSGYKPNDNDPSVFSFATVNTSAIVEVQRMALVGSKPFLIAMSVIVGSLVVLLGILVATTKADQLDGFELGNIVKRLLQNYALKIGVY